MTVTGRGSLSAASRDAPTLYLGTGAALYLGSALDTAVHAHHAVQICVALTGRFRLRADADAPWGRYHGAVVRSDYPHQLDSADAHVALLYLEPESAAARRLMHAMGRADITRPAPATAVACATALDSCVRPDGANVAQICQEVVALLAPGAGPARPMDARVAAALVLLRASAGRPVGASEIASRVGLSAGRFGHLFRACVGLPMRRYLLWLRLGQAVREIAGGSNLTDAAHAAGFADAAHFSRTCRRMFGITPSALAGHSRIVQAESPPV